MNEKCLSIHKIKCFPLTQHKMISSRKKLSGTTLNSEKFLHQSRKIPRYGYCTERVGLAKKSLPAAPLIRVPLYSLPIFV